jgi:hypothetical protein
MRIIFKILAMPFVVLLTISGAALVFVFQWAKALLNIASGISVLLALILFFSGQTTGGIVFAIIAFLISPVGLPGIAEWLINMLDDLNYALKTFILT